jgi:hypothetical protein
MKSNGASESHQNNNLKVLISFAHFLGPNVTFYDIKRSDMITSFLDTKIELRERSYKKRIITWNDYLGRIKYFMRWFHNYWFEAANYQDCRINAYTAFFVRCSKDRDNPRINSKSNSDYSRKNAFYSVLELKGP